MAVFFIEDIAGNQSSKDAGLVMRVTAAAVTMPSL